MKIFLIGGSGFIGTRLANLLNNSKIPFAIVDKQVSSDFPNVTTKADVRSSREMVNSIDDNSVVINLAAEHLDNVIPKSLYHEVNVIGALNVCEAARIRSVNKIIFTSSVAVYGFAPIGATEWEPLAPFNDYGKTKIEAERIYIEWQLEDPEVRSLVIIRPTVVFGERNRGNVYNLLKQIASGNFVMVGDGLNRKSMAYVENVASFLKFSLGFRPGVHIFNYVDKPDFNMRSLIQLVNELLGRSTYIKFRIPFFLGILIGVFFDTLSVLTRKKFPISSIRVKKFCSDSVYSSSIDLTGFIPPVPLMEAIEKTVKFEFLESNKTEDQFSSE
jgi:nucleoside-diphosphate-sugar epimerase